MEKDESDNTSLAAVAVLATRSSSTSTSTSTSTVTAPSALTYTGSPYTFSTGSAITTQTPTVTGTVTSCTASPSLPTGLSISATTCAISGTPTTTQSATTYTITASNSAGSTTASISITIGTAPSSISFAKTSYSFTDGSAITTRTPSINGTITSCTISPSLPAGLSISSTTCAISGTPTATQSATTHTVTASNAAGSVSTTVSITVSQGSTCSSTSSTGTTVLASTATLDTSTDCATGVTTCMDKTLPAWIKDNFKCAVGYVSGTNYVFKSQNIPNTKSYYFTAYNGQTPVTTYPLYEALPSGNSKAGSNVVISQNLTYTVPATPTKGTGTDSTQGGLVSIGITANGLAVFNNAAAPPDVLASEAATFDNYQGHPQSSGVYHHHAAVPKICDSAANTSNSGACNNASLIGIALDGYAIYGQKCDKGTESTTDDATPTDLDSLHGHTAVTTHFSTATYHYHYANDTTATIYTLMGSFFYGNKGSVSN